MFIVTFFEMLHKKEEHDVKPRVLVRAFSSGFADACAKTQKLSATDTVRQKRRFIANAPEFDTGKTGGKSRSQFPLRSKH